MILGCDEFKGVRLPLSLCSHVPRDFRVSLFKKLQQLLGSFVKVL